jgi:hypothetical protein
MMEKMLENSLGKYAIEKLFHAEEGGMHLKIRRS